MPPPSPARRRSGNARTPQASGTADSAVVIRPVRSPRQEFPVPDRDGQTRLDPPNATRALPGSRTRSRRTRSFGWAVAALVLVLVGIALDGSDGDGGEPDRVEMGSELSPYGLPTEVTDLGVLPADHVFTFEGNPDLWDSEVPGWRLPDRMVRVYLDPALTVPAPDAWVHQDYDDDTGGTLEVAAAHETPLWRADTNETVPVAIGNRWGAAAEYYLVQLADLDTGEPLDRLPVQRFEVADDRPRPVVEAAVDDGGVLTLSWQPVDGATRVDVLDPSYGFRSLGESPDRAWRSDLADTDDGYRQNEVLSLVGGFSEDLQARAGESLGVREVTGLAVSALLQGGRIAVVPVDSAVLSRVPVEPAFEAASRLGLRQPMDPEDLPGAVPWVMVDGSTALLPVTYDPDTVTALFDGVFEVGYTTHGAGPIRADPLQVRASSPDQAVQEIGERNAALDAERDPAGPPVPYTY